MVKAVKSSGTDDAQNAVDTADVDTIKPNDKRIIPTTAKSIKQRTNKHDRNL